jgi:hypothetical protein
MRVGKGFRLAKQWRQAICYGKRERLAARPIFPIALGNGPSP